MMEMVTLRIARTDGELMETIESMHVPRVGDFVNVAATGAQLWLVKKVGWVRKPAENRWYVQLLVGNP